MTRVNELLTTNARDLRNNATKAERLLWRRLSAYRPRFTRQLVIGLYIVDFACREAKLAIELDGSQHIDAAAYDERRTFYLEQDGASCVCGTTKSSRILTEPLSRYSYVVPSG